MLATKPTKERAVRHAAAQTTSWEANARVRTPMNRGSKEKLKWLGTILFCTAIASGLIYRYALIAEGNLQVESLKEQVMKKQDEVAKLTKNKQDLERPARIIEIAKDQLGMVFATSPAAQGSQNGE
jgi:cell division protein FtsL